MLKLNVYLFYKFFFSKLFLCSNAAIIVPYDKRSKSPPIGKPQESVEIFNSNGFNLSCIKNIAV